MAKTTFNFDEYQEILREGQQRNATSSGTKFKIIRFYLDKTLDRYSQGETGHFFGSGIKSFWVCATNNKTFTASIVPNPSSDRVKGSGLPLRFNMNQSFVYPVHDACLEFSSQPGVWIDIAYSESEDIQIGSIEASLNASTIVNEGATYNSAAVTASTTPAELLPADSARYKAVLQHKSGGSIWIGSQADLNDANYQNICLELSAGSTTEWWSKGQLYFRSSSGAPVFSRVIFKE